MNGSPSSGLLEHPQKQHISNTLALLAVFSTILGPLPDIEKTRVDEDLYQRMRESVRERQRERGVY